MQDPVRVKHGPDGCCLSAAAVKKLQRGISRANCALVSLGRQRVTEDDQDHAHSLVDTPMYTFILPDLALFPAQFRAFVEKDLLELTTMTNLEKTGTRRAAFKICRSDPMDTYRYLPKIKQGVL